MGIYKFLILIPVAGVILAIGLFVYAKVHYRNVADPEQLTTDPALKLLQAGNPHLAIIDEFTRLPVYWIKVPATGQKIMFPKSEAPGAKIRVVECDLAAIPQQVLYPNREEIHCLEVDNDEHRLSAFFFRTNDRLKQAVGFYEAPLDPTRRFGTSRSNTEERREERKLADGTREFLFSFFMAQRYDLSAFVGYREEKKKREE